jgi:hypothetical protein
VSLPGLGFRMRLGLAVPVVQEMPCEELVALVAEQERRIREQDQRIGAMAGQMAGLAAANAALVAQNRELAGKLARLEHFCRGTRGTPRARRPRTARRARRRRGGASPAERAGRRRPGGKQPGARGPPGLGRGPGRAAGPVPAGPLRVRAGVGRRRGPWGGRQLFADGFCGGGADSKVRRWANARPGPTPVTAPP